MDYYKKRFSLEKIEELKNENAIVDGSLGGLLLGPSHEEEGIYFLIKDGDSYSLEGEVEGYEFIITSNKYLTTLKFNELNNRLRDIKFNFTGNENLNGIRKINAISPNKEKYKSKYVIFNEFNFSIINKNSTKRFLKELQEINE